MGNLRLNCSSCLIAVVLAGSNHLDVYSRLDFTIELFVDPTRVLEHLQHSLEVDSINHLYHAFL